MCMDEFVKRLYDFMGIYKIFWSQNSDYRYLPIFFQKFLHKRVYSTVAIFRWKNRFFPIFRRKIGDFTDFFPIFPLSIFPLIFLLGADRKLIVRPKKPIFCSLLLSETSRRQRCPVHILLNYLRHFFPSLRRSFPFRLALLMLFLLLSLVDPSSFPDASTKII